MTLPCMTKFSAKALAASAPAALPFAAGHGQFFKNIFLPGSQNRVDFTAYPGHNLYPAAHKTKGAAGNTPANEKVCPAGHHRINF